MMEVVMLSQYQANLTEEHLEGLYLIFYHLCKNPCKRTVFGSSELDADAKFHVDADWTNFYGDIVEGDPPNMQESLGKPVKMWKHCQGSHILES